MEYLEEESKRCEAYSYAELATLLQRDIVDFVQRAIVQKCELGWM